MEPHVRLFIGPGNAALDRAMLEHRLADLVLCPAAQKRRPPESDPQTSTLRAHVLAQASADAQALQAIARASYPHLLQATGPGALRNLVLALSHESRPQGDAAPGRGRILTACAAVCLDLGSQQRYEACFEQTHADAQCLQPLGVHGGAGVPRPVGVLAAQALDAIHNQASSRARRHRKAVRPGLDCTAPNCMRCRAPFGAARRIWCSNCATTVCADCCSSPVLRLVTSQPTATCRDCARPAARANPFSFSIPASEEDFLGWSEREVILGPEDGPPDHEDCPGCGEAFSFFRKRWHCGGCAAVYCLKCLRCRPGTEDPTRLCPGCLRGGAAPEGRGCTAAVHVMTRLLCPVTAADVAADPDCQGCGAPFALWRLPVGCADCGRVFCPKCLLRKPGQCARAPRRCVACVYGPHFAHRRVGVDRDVPACLVCGEPFSFLTRRHWCRRCGRTICGGCSATGLSAFQRRHPDCLCEKCFVPPVRRLTHNLVQYILQYVDRAGQTAINQVSKRFQHLVPLPYPGINQFSDYFDVDPEKDLLGEGAFGRVYTAVCKRSRATRAVKVISKSKLYTVRQQQFIQREIAILQDLNHPNTVPVYEVMQTRTELFIVMDRVPETHVIPLARQLLQFLRYLHCEKSVVHRDLKLDNVLISHTDPQTEPIVKVIDFGLARQYHPPSPDPAPFAPPPPDAPSPPAGAPLDPGPSGGGSQHLPVPEALADDGVAGPGCLCTPCGTLRYCAPEVLVPWSHARPMPRAHVFKRDIFSAGVLLYALLCGRMPYPARTLPQLLEAMRRPLEYPSAPPLSDAAKDFLAALCHPKASGRPTAAEALRHPWLSPASGAPAAALVLASASTHQRRKGQGIRARPCLRIHVGADSQGDAVHATHELSGYMSAGDLDLHDSPKRW